MSAQNKMHGAAAVLFDAAASKHNNHTKADRTDTIQRFSSAWNDIFDCKDMTIDQMVDKMTLFPAESRGGRINQMVLVRDIHFYTMCEHHMLPFFGKVHIAYLPRDKICGLSKLVRLSRFASQRLQVQERYTNQIADIMEASMSPLGVAVVSQARHMCMEMRGVCHPGSTTTCSELRGEFLSNASLRSEFFETINADRRL